MDGQALARIARDELLSAGITYALKRGYNYLHQPMAYRGLTPYYKKQVGGYLGYTQGRKRLAKPSYKSGKRYKKTTIRYGYFGSELKFSDSEVLLQPMTETWGTLNPTGRNSLSAVAQGTSESEHLGRTMYITSIHLRGTLDFLFGESKTGPEPTPDCRFAIVLDTDTKGVQAAATDVMDVGQTKDILAFRNLQHTSRLKVMHDRRFIIRQVEMNEGSVNLFAHPTTRVKWQFHKRFNPPIRVLFSGTTAVVGSIVDNSFHFIQISTTTDMRVEYQCRLRFKDTI